MVFGNFERRLPEKERSYYREYTVPTPGSRNRGARRIIVGREGEYYYARRPLPNISSYPGVTAVDALSKLLTEFQFSGVYRPVQGADEIARAARVAKLSIVKLDLGTLHGKRGFCASRQSSQVPQFFRQQLGCTQRLSDRSVMAGR